MPDADHDGDGAETVPEGDVGPASTGAGVPARVERPAPARDLNHLLGTTLAEKYRVDEVLGVGGMGTVFRARHLLLKRDVAVKVLHPELGANSEIRERFNREAQSAARLEHPNIVHVSEYGSTQNDVKFMVMQLLEGRELIEDLGAPMDPARVYSLACQLFSGLEHAHQNGVIHRDLKPENIYLTRDHEGTEVIKLVDFGIAKLVLDDEEEGDALRTLTQLGMVFGTPRYMSPEQATGSPIDPRTDLYSAGIILYEMLAGPAPFENEDPVALVRMQVSMEPPPLPDSVPGDLGAIVYRLLEKQRDDRFANATEVRAALEEVGARMSTGVVPRLVATPAKRARQRAWRQKWLPIAVAGAAMLGVALFVATRDDDGPAPTPAPVPAPVPQPDDAQAHDGLTDEALAKIDKEILSKRSGAALDLIKPLLDDLPKHPTLLWRQGRALALQRSKRALALTSYSDALEEDTELIEDHDFYAELIDLLQDRKLRDQALDVAVQKMGPAGHKFLLQLVNEPDPKRALDYADRHRALDALADDSDNAPLVDRRLNVARDLWQSSRGQSVSPCADFANALTAISVSADPFFGPGLRRAKLPKEPESPGACDGLGDRLETVTASITALEEAAKANTDGTSSTGDG